MGSKLGESKYEKEKTSEKCQYFEKHSIEVNCVLLHLLG